MCLFFVCLCLLYTNSASIDASSISIQWKRLSREKEKKMWINSFTCLIVKGRESFSLCNKSQHYNSTSNSSNKKQILQQVHWVTEPYNAVVVFLSIQTIVTIVPPSSLLFFHPTTVLMIFIEKYCMWNICTYIEIYERKRKGILSSQVSFIHI